MDAYGSNNVPEDASERVDLNDDSIDWQSCSKNSRVAVVNALVLRAVVTHSEQKQNVFCSTFSAVASTVILRATLQSEHTCCDAFSRP